MDNDPALRHGHEAVLGPPCRAARYVCQRLFLHVWQVGQPRAIQVADWRWVRLDELDDFSFAVTDCKIIQALRKQ
jgi:hypothetical protein